MVNFDFLPDDFNAVLEYVRNSTNIGYLDLNYNNIGVEGAIALARELANNTTITFLNLSGNRFGYQGAEALADALTINSTITSLEGSLIHNYGALVYEEMEKNIAISELTLIFQRDFSNIELKTLPSELEYMVQQYQQKPEYRNFTKLKKPAQIYSTKGKLKPIFNSWKVYKDYNEKNSNKKNTSFIPRKLLLQFVENDEMSSKFITDKLKDRVIEKLRRIVTFDYINVIERLNSKNPSKIIPINDSLKTLPFEQIEEILFETYKDTILKQELDQVQNVNQRKTLEKDHERMKKTILFYMLPDNIIQQYFTPTKSEISPQQNASSGKQKKTLSETLTVIISNLTNLTNLRKTYPKQKQTRQHLESI